MVETLLVFRLATKMGAQENVPAQETVEASTDSTAIVENAKDTNFKGNEDRLVLAAARKRNRIVIGRSSSEESRTT